LSAQQPYFYSPVLCSSFDSGVVSYRVRLAHPEDVHPEQGNLVLLRKVTPNRVGPLRGELKVISIGATSIGKALNFEYEVLAVSNLGSKLVEDRPRVRR